MSSRRKEIKKKKMEILMYREREKEKERRGMKFRCTISAQLQTCEKRGKSNYAKERDTKGHWDRERGSEREREREREKFIIIFIAFLLSGDSSLLCVVLFLQTHTHT